MSSIQALKWHLEDWGSDEILFPKGLQCNWSKMAQLLFPVFRLDFLFPLTTVHPFSFERKTKDLHKVNLLTQRHLGDSSSFSRFDNNNNNNNRLLESFEEGKNRDLTDEKESRAPVTRIPLLVNIARTMAVGKKLSITTWLIACRLSHNLNQQRVNEGNSCPF